jgi:hypothetical protein
VSFRLKRSLVREMLRRAFRQSVMTVSSAAELLLVCKGLRCCLTDSVSLLTDLYCGRLRRVRTAET